MISRLAGGWQTTMADLALILFIVSVAGLQAGKGSEVAADLPAQGEPLAVYSAREGAPPLGEWLAEQTPDARQRLTIVATYRGGDAGEAARRALRLAAEAGDAEHSARIVLEQSNEARLVASLAYDRPPEQVARSLQEIPRD